VQRVSNFSPTDFDPLDPRFVEDGVPFDKLARIRAECPVARLKSGSWYLSRFADVEAALQDVATFRADLGPITGFPGGVDTVPPEEHFLSEINEPEHRQVRQIFLQAMAGPRLKALEPVLIEEMQALVDAMLQKPVADLHADYALQIPAIAMRHLMGLERGAIDRFAKWSVDGQLMCRPSSPHRQPDEIQRYFGQKLAEQRIVRDNPVFLNFIDAEIGGKKLTDMQIVMQLHFMIQAGVHTTRSLLVHLMNRLVQEPQLFTELEKDRALVPRYVEESLRHDAPVQRTTRRCTRDIEFAGVSIKRGESVEMGIGSANRDEARYDDADAFDVLRKPDERPGARQHLGFGAGSHVCPGASLARMEAAACVNVLLDRCSRAEMVEGVRYPPIPGSLGHQAVPARLVSR
jgi:cytochrome P450